MSLKQNPEISRYLISHRIKFRKEKWGGVIYSLDTEDVYIVNTYAYKILMFLTYPRTRAEIEAYCKRLKIHPEAIERFLNTAIELSIIHEIKPNEVSFKLNQNIAIKKSSKSKNE